ncbi:hypothetical protein P8R33_06420 [Qipengyuania sp. XHP0211]|uniref:hypothetical protein n=1 Tax=Qipengyuania sp. XHP0211 TaxID=3038079 RepID=UPI00241F0FE6|nr:hypothetical protein [Qipengyuania sp. XHP0211]MDG5750730.1 hypothetical protein [Qipengyuania sp. XHP0211]
MLKLTFPRSHQLEDLRPLYEEFKLAHPAVFDEFRKRGKAYRDGTVPVPEEYSEDPVYSKALDSVSSFLKSRTQWEFPSALTAAFMDFRRLLERELDMLTDDN